MRRLIAAFRPAVARMMASSAPCSPSATVAWVIHAPISVGPRSAAGSLATRKAREDLVQVLHGRSQRIEPPRPDQIEREQAQQLERAQTGNRTGLAADVQRRRRPADVQLMGLCQSKGREADATIVVLRGNDYFGKESEPMPVGSKLLYVVLTRGRTETIVLTLGSTLPFLSTRLRSCPPGAEQRLRPVLPSSFGQSHGWRRSQFRLRHLDRPEPGRLARHGI